MTYSSSLKATHAFENITAKQAERILAHNEANRGIRNGKVDQYCRDMVEGRWNLCVAPIVIDVNGNLMDGQHRLTAQVKANKSIRWLVLRNVDPDVQKNIDTGTARSAADVLGYAGEKYPGPLATTARLVYRIKSNSLSGRTAESVSVDEIIDTVNEEPLIRWGITLGMESSKKMTPIAPSVLAAAHWMIAGVNGEEEATSFITRIANLSGELAGSPVLALNRRVNEIRRGQVRVKPRDFLALVIKTWNYDANGQKVNKLALKSKTGEFVLPKVDKRKVNVFLIDNVTEEDDDEVQNDDEIVETGEEESA